MERYVTLRCVSNTLKSDLMGTAAWSGIRLSHLIDRAQLAAGHRGSRRSSESTATATACAWTMPSPTRLLLALGMNGKTLDRTHGFPIRLLAPRYYGFKNVKWISEIAFVSQPYFGTWPKLGYTKEPVVHIASHIDRDRADPGGLRHRRRLVRRDARHQNGPSPRRCGAVGGRDSRPAALALYLDTLVWRSSRSAQRPNSKPARMDGTGRWQEAVEGPLFPNGVTGPTIRRLGYMSVDSWPPCVVALGLGLLSGEVAAGITRRLPELPQRPGAEAPMTSL